MGNYFFNSTEMSFHHRVTQSITEFYSFDFKLIKLCETQCYSVVRRSLCSLHHFVQPENHSIYFLFA